MYNGRTVAVVVPAYNEEGFVGEVIETLPTFVDRAYVVDDRSTDDTWAEIQRNAAAVNDSRRELVVADGGATAKARVVPIRHDENRGVGAAIKTGYRRALDDGMDVTAVMNGDGQMDPDILDQILEPVVSGAAGYAKGNRLETPADREEMSAWRLFGNVVLTGLTKIASGYWEMQDSQNGYTAISEEALATIDIDGLYDSYGFLNNLLVELNVHDIPIADVNMRAKYGNESSGITYSSFVPSLSYLLLRNFLRRLIHKYVISDFHPLVACYLFGILSLGFGSAIMLVYLATAGQFSRLGPAAGAGVLFGTSFITLAMVLDWRSNHGLHRSTGKIVDTGHRGETA